MKWFFVSTMWALWCLILVGCGFHLRGSGDDALPASLQRLYVQGINLQQDMLGVELKRALTRHGVSVLKHYEQGAAILTILQNRYQKNVLSVGTDAKVREYELQSLLHFKVTDDKGQVLVADQKVEAARDFQFDIDQIIAMDEQERVLRADLNRQLVQSMLRRLSALK